MLTENHEIRIMDFGLSKSHLVTTMSTTGSVLGTLGYVAPEQITGVDVDHRADQFSLGVIAYEMFTGIMPFEGENEMALIHSIFNTSPPVPSAVDASISDSLSTLIMRCLEKEPSGRYESVSDIITCLEKTALEI